MAAQTNPKFAEAGAALVGITRKVKPWRRGKPWCTTVPVCVCGGRAPGLQVFRWSDPQHDPTQLSGWLAQRQSASVSRCYSVESAESVEENSMTIGMSTSRFVAKAIEVHGALYDYSNVGYVNSKTHVEIRCLRHGVFLQTPNRHLRGGGCSPCWNEHRGDAGRLGQDAAIQRLVEVHGGRYSYETTVYRGIRKLIQIQCRNHGMISMRYDVHLSGAICRLCATEELREYRLGKPSSLSPSATEFAEMAKAVGMEVIRYSGTLKVHSDLRCLECRTEKTGSVRGGCSLCARRRRNPAQMLELDSKTPCEVYAVRFSVGLAKFGITTHDLDSRRFSGITKKEGLILPLRTAMLVERIVLEATLPWLPDEAAARDTVRNRGGWTEVRVDEREMWRTASSAFGLVFRDSNFLDSFM